MNFFTVKQFSKKWGISERRIINLCREGRISGAIKNGMVWMIPEDTVKPADKRTKVVKYINTEKRVVIVNIYNEIGNYLVPILKKEGIIVEGICDINDKENDNNTFFTDVLIRKIDYKNKLDIESKIHDSEKYYDGLIIIDLENEIQNKELIIDLFSKKMNCTSSIVLVNRNETKKNILLTKFVSNLKEKIGIRINSISLDIPKENTVIINYNEIAEDIEALLTKFKNTTGVIFKTDGGYIQFNKNGKTDNLGVGKFYKAINNYFNKLDKNSNMWCASMMLEDEWTEEPLEMNFRVSNLEAANRGVNLERIFIFSKDRIQEFKNNKTLNIYIQSNIKTMFVDYDEVIVKEPELIKIVGNGWDGIDKSTLIVDLSENDKERGYISINKKEVQKAYNCFQKLKQYSKDLKEILK